MSSFGGRGRRQLRVVVDRKGGISSEQLEQISRGLSLQLDAEDPIGGRYNLEVSSPGLDWPLTTESDFSRYLGACIAVQKQDGDKVVGRNLGLEDGKIGLSLTVGKVEREISIAWDEVVRVVRTVCWDEVSQRRKG